MAFSGGGWNIGSFGNFCWGMAMSGAVATGTRITDSMAQMLTQMPSTPIQIGATVIIDNVDVTEKCRDFRITLRSDGSASDADLNMLDDSVTVNLHQSIVSIFINYIDADGNTFENERARLKAHIIAKNTGNAGTTQKITCFDLGYAMTEHAPIAYANNVINSGSGIFAPDLINLEILASGGSVSYGATATRYELNGFTPSSYTSSREEIWRLANGGTRLLMFVDNTGLIRFTAYDDATPGPWTFPLAFQISQQPSDSAISRYNRVIATSYAYGYYNDTADQAERGIQSITINSETATADTNFLSYVATSYGKQSMQQTIVVKTPLHAFVMPTENITLTLKDGSTVIAKVYSVEDTGSATNGYYSTWTLKKVSP